ncbi:MAG TPA: metalloregulator ArsR/SmtB family transcription factor [Casimicrobiaceae bacterium]|nr:metalloregulator ArsR/SmtB family transcription factor [Casimicrobiaceae bacterium]
MNKTLASEPTKAGHAPRMRELQRDARRVASLLKAMSNPARLVILCQIAEGERSVGELERAVGLSQSSISQHLAVLRAQAVVSGRRVGQTVLYSLASGEVAALMSTLHAVFCRQSPAPRIAGSRVRTA